MKKKSFFVFILVFSLHVNAQIVKYSNEFLAIGVGARALGMGTAVVSSTSDVTAGYWNPAGLVGISSNIQGSLMHSEYFAGIAKYDYGALGMRIDSSSAASISFVRFGVDNIANTLQLVDANGNVDYDKISKFNVSDFAAILSYARKISKIDGLDLGTNAKIIRRRIGDFGGAWGFGVDAAINYKWKAWKFSAVGRDITGTFNAWSYNLTDETKQVFTLTGNEIPKNSLEVTMPRVVLGAARLFNVWKDKISLLTELNLITTFDGKRNVVFKSNSVSADPAFGLELSYIKMIFLRFGVNNIQQYTNIQQQRKTSIQPNLGLGIRYKGIELSYAFTDLGDASIAPYSNVFSLNFNINKKIKFKNQ